MDSECTMFGAQDSKEHCLNSLLLGLKTSYLYDGQMPVMEQDFEGGVLRQSRVHFLGARGIEAMVAIDHTRGNQAALRWLLYDGHGNLVRTMTPDYALSGWQWRGVWGERTDTTAGRGYCANLGHPEDETGLVYMRACYYEPATGRFLSEDPTRDGVNWYLYADGNPVGKVDVEGRETEDDGGLLGWICLAAASGVIGGAAYDIAKWLWKEIGRHAVANFLRSISKRLMRQAVHEGNIAAMWHGAALAAKGTPLESLFSGFSSYHAKNAARRLAWAIMLRNIADFLEATAD